MTNKNKSPLWLTPFSYLSKKIKGLSGGRIDKLSEKFVDSIPESTKEIEKSHIILWMIALFLAVALLWARFAVIDEVTVAEGKVIPASKIQIIQHLEGGIVKKILVQEGQRVKSGEILLYLDDIRYSGEFKTNQLKKIELKLRIARLTAEFQNKPFHVPEELKKQPPSLASTEMALYKSRIEELKSLVNRRKLLKNEITMTKPLVNEGAVSKVEVLRLEQKLGELEGKIYNMHSTTLNELNTAKNELSQLEENTATVKDRLERTSIRSPVDGIVKQIHIATVGAVIKPGMALMEIVPLEDTLRVEAQVRPSDIGFIHPGQKAIVKITAYDFSIYGGLQGNVEHISADTSKDEKGNSYYEIWVRTQKAYLGTVDKKLPIIPGMQASVDILTGKKTILDYILKPILRSKERALRER